MSPPRQRFTLRAVWRENAPGVRVVLQDLPKCLEADLVHPLEQALFRVYEAPDERHQQLAQTLHSPSGAAACFLVLASGLLFIGGSLRVRMKRSATPLVCGCFDEGEAGRDAPNTSP